MYIYVLCRGQKELVLCCQLLPITSFVENNSELTSHGSILVDNQMLVFIQIMDLPTIQLDI